jgi:RNA polymerase sigma-70 factor (ECF subfamily)
MSNIQDWGDTTRGGRLLDGTIPGAISSHDSPAASYEAELISRAQRLDPDAWTELYERNHDRIYRYVYTRVSFRETAEDLTAATFLEALKGIRSYEQRGRPILAWLYRIARNVVNYHHRKSGRAGAPPQSLEGSEAVEAITIADEEQDPALLIDGLDVREALDALSADQRDAVILRFYVGLTTPEAAKVMGKSERAVYSLQTRAIKSLRRLLEPPQ